MRKKLEELWYGAEEPFLCSVDSEGFDMEEDDFEVELVGESGSLVYGKEDLIHTDSGEWYVMVVTTALGAGIVTAVTTLSIPDELCPGGVRKEVDSQEICFIRERPRLTFKKYGVCKCNI